jgi:hypothetical protein
MAGYLLVQPPGVAAEAAAEGGIGGPAGVQVASE